MTALTTTARTIGLLCLCLVAFGTGFFIGQHHRPEPIVYPTWVDTVCMEGKAAWGEVARRECHVIELP